MSDMDKHLQVARQYRATAHLATQLAMLCFDMAEMTLANVDRDAGVLSLRGDISHYWMETLGDLLNNVDAADDETIRWMTPIYERARKMFPLENAQESPADEREGRGSPASEQGA